MTAIDRTAYPRLGARLTREELAVRYHLTETDRTFIDARARGDTGRLMLATLLTTRRDLGRFPASDEVHAGTVAYLAAQLGVAAPQSWSNGARRTKTLYRYQAAVRAHLSLTPYDAAAERLVASTVLEAAETMSDPADLINRTVEALQATAIDLPAFSTLDRLVSRLRAEAHGRMYDRVAAHLATEHTAVLDALLAKLPDSPTTGFNRLKQAPGPATPKTVRLWNDRLDWLGGLIDPDPLLEGIAHTKLRQFAAEAAALDVGDLLDIAQPGKRHTLLLALLRQARMRCRDELIEMMLRRIRRTQAAAKEQLDALHDQHRAIEETLIGIFGQVLETAQAQDSDAAFGRQVRKLLAEQGGVPAAAVAHPRQAPRPAVPATRPNGHTLGDPGPQPAGRSGGGEPVPPRTPRRGAGRRRSRLRVPALAGLRRQTPARTRHVRPPGAGGVRIRPPGRRLADRRPLRRRCRDLRRLPRPAPALAECAVRLPAYCAALGIPERGEDFAAALKAELTTLAREVDAGFPANTELSVDADGTPHLRQLATTEQPAGLAEFEQEIRARMPERHLLDILKHTEHWSRYTRHFGPPSGSDPKLAQAVRRYLFTVFGYGCNLGPGQTARHAPEVATAQALRRINAQHINADKLEAAMVDVIGQYARFPLPRHWGSGRAAIADGTHVKLRENNLLGSRHIRYGGYGGIAYHHIADSYIALFTSFIPCGVWEAVHILDGLLKNRSDIQPDTLHADTQGQSEPVFGLCRLLGIKLMPRMRGLGDVAFYRPARSIRYKHIDTLFGGEIDWGLIATHARDMIQVVRSIQAGRVMPSMLLRRLGTYNRRSLLYRAFRELGRVERTLFLLRFISSIEVRRVIRAETAKIESYNDFLDWVSFGGPVIKSGDPVEQEKHLKYAGLVANAIMLSNVADMTTALSAMAADSHPVTPTLVACLSPYTRGHILRFGRYALDMDDLPGPLDPQPLPFEQAL